MKEVYTVDLSFATLPQYINNHTNNADSVDTMSRVAGLKNLDIPLVNSIAPREVSNTPTESIESILEQETYKEDKQTSLEEAIQDYNQEDIVDDGSNSTNERAVEVSTKPGDMAPMINLNAPLSGGVGSSILFDASGSFDSDGSIAMYKFDFGNGDIYQESASSAADGAFDGIYAYQFEQPGNYQVSVTVVDNSGNTNTITQNINIENQAPNNLTGINYVNGTPQIVQSFNINENPSGKIQFGQVVGSDPDSGSKLTYSLSADALNQGFLIDSKNGVLSFQGNLDYENIPDHKVEIEIQVQDQFGGNYKEKFSVNINNINEAPLSLSLSNNFVSENSTIAIPKA